MTSGKYCAKHNLNYYRGTCFSTKMKTPLDSQNIHDDDEDVKIIITSPESSTSTQLLDPSGNKIGEVELNTYDSFAYATESYSSTVDRIVWGEEDTNLLLEKYELYILQVGPRKRFHSKKYMWNQIANDIYAKFKLILTGVQCENRYKTVCKRRKQFSENNSKLSNSKTSVVSEEEKGITPDDSVESDVVKNGGQVNLEKLEQTNHELAQQIENCSVRFVTMIEKLEKHHNRQQQKLEKSIQEHKEAFKTEFATLLEKLDKIHTTIEQNQEHQKQILEKLIKEQHEQHQTDFVKLSEILEKIHHTLSHDIKISKIDYNPYTMKHDRKDEKKRSKSRSPSPKKGARDSSPCSPPRKRHHSSTSRSRSHSKCRHKSPISSRTFRRSRSNEKHNAGSRSSKTRNSEHFPHSARQSKHDRRYKSESRSPKRITHRSCQDSSCKQRDKYR